MFALPQTVGPWWRQKRVTTVIALVEELPIKTRGVMDKPVFWGTGCGSVWHGLGRPLVLACARMSGGQAG